MNKALKKVVGNPVVKWTTIILALPVAGLYLVMKDVAEPSYVIPHVTVDIER